MKCEFIVQYCRFVGTFIPRKERLKDMGHNTKFTNLYIKNFGDDLSDNDLNQLFTKFGKIVSAVVMKDRNTGKSLGYGFVSFDDHDSAQSVSCICRIDKKVFSASFATGIGSDELVQDD